MSDTFFLIVGIILAILGALIFIASISRDVSCSRQMMAKVVKVERDGTRHWKGTYPYYPTFSYLVNGQEYNIKSDTYTRSHTKYKVGQEVMIHYNPKSPEQIRLGVQISSYLFSIVLMGIGGVLIGIYCTYCL